MATASSRSSSGRKHFSHGDGKPGNVKPSARWRLSNPTWLAMRRKILHSIVFATLTVSSCSANPVEPDELASTDALVQALKQQDAAVTWAGELPPLAYSFFSVRAQRILVNNADVQVFEYASAARADRDAAQISPTGTPIGQSQISWMDTPHFYKRDRLIVLYVGHSADILRALEAVLGPPFAAGR